MHKNVIDKETLDPQDIKVGGSRGGSLTLSLKIEGRWLASETKTIPRVYTVATP